MIRKFSGNRESQGETWKLELWNERPLGKRRRRMETTANRICRTGKNLESRDGEPGNRGN
jgi:hypothetical protein